MDTPQPDTKTVVGLVAEAVAAPSMHNAQPWRFRFLASERVLLLFADLDRAMPSSDPGNRALHIGCGASLFTLRVAAAHAGVTPTVSLLPDPAEPLRLAAVRLGGTDPAAPEDDLARLHPAVRRRHTSRYPFDEKDIPEDVRAALRAAADREGAELQFPGPWHVETILELVHDAESRDVLHPENAGDLRRWTRLGPEADAATDGVPEYAFGPRMRGGKAPMRDFAGRRPVADRGTTSFETNPHLALLSTPGDTPADWLRAGQALQRVLLEATLAGLATSLTSHALESRDLRLLTRDPVAGRGHVQMVLRLGYGPQGPATPRRSVREVLDIVQTGGS
ncbi:MULTISPECIES: Acg family FMN-binding oxidoreductase [unclassified Streptomyces]|uniref:Acg family FMN-binding oxidoreductase n=1 Tax=unclassified Streptomyces TaxID=2593676 RepID=UPI0004C8F01B|nr:MULTISPECIES: nitroreductase family protein [unclassified Streptomyces]KOV76436.1 nitroreductase [Streptomyces sp. NRRL WC-3723]